jgi:alpha-galactosidase
MIGEVSILSVGCNGGVQVLCFDRIRLMGLGFSIISCPFSQLSPKDLIREHPDWALVRPVNS